jgi:hypothetical protein
MISTQTVNGAASNSLCQMVGGNPGEYPASIVWANREAALKFANAANPAANNFYFPPPTDFHLRYDSPGVSGTKITNDGKDAGADVPGS